MFKLDENYLIKGDNLEVMKKLLPYYKNKIKCIYIDPPYNTGSKSFNYNDNFSSLDLIQKYLKVDLNKAKELKKDKFIGSKVWIEFMKERLIIVKEFLRDDGVIWVQCDDNEQAYLKVLMDEIFGRINFISLITCKTKTPSGVASNSQPLFNCSEYIICFAKNKNKLSFNHIFEEVEIIDNLSKSRKFYNYCLNYINFSKKEFIKNFGNGKLYKIPYNDFNITKMKSFSSFEFYNMFDKIFRLGSLSGANEKKIKRFLDKNNDSKECVFVYEHNLNGKMRSDLIYKNSGVLMLKNYAKINHIDKNVKKIQHITSLFTNDWWQGISSEGGILFKNGKKPEILMKTLFDIFTNENDIIMDFFAGSGTILAVAHKMNRHYIGIEMNDYIESITYKRLMNVIEGDQSGISKEVDWKGGGSFNFIKNLI